MSIFGEFTQEDFEIAERWIQEARAELNQFSMAKGGMYDFNFMTETFVSRPYGLNWEFVRDFTKAHRDLNPMPSQYDEEELDRVDEITFPPLRSSISKIKGRDSILTVSTREPDDDEIPARPSGDWAFDTV